MPLLIELGGDEIFIPIQSTAGQRLAYGIFIAIVLGCIDTAVADFQCREHCISRFLSAHGPGPQSDRRHAHATGKFERRNIGDHVLNLPRMIAGGQEASKNPRHTGTQNRRMGSVGLTLFRRLSVQPTTEHHEG